MDLRAAGDIVIFVSNFSKIIVDIIPDNTVFKSR
jgi:hypothetical protein